MTTFLRSLSCLGLAVLLSAALPVFAESAPVYDADSLPQQYDANADAAPEELPPTPAAEEMYLPPQPPMPTEATVQPLSMDQRLQRIERQVANMQSSDASTKADALQAQVQALRGQLEQITHQLEQMQAQQKTMYADLDKRLTQQAATPTANAKVVAATETPPTTLNTETILPPKTPVKSKSKAAENKLTATAAKAGDNQPNVAEEQQIYQTAYDQIKAKKYSDAIATLQGMLNKYPSGQFAANAHYWLGELYGLLNKNNQALTEFNTVVKSYPDSPRVADAQLKVGLIYASQSQWTEAKAAFKKAISRYPGTASARLASEQLKQLKQAGH